MGCSYGGERALDGTHVDRVQSHGVVAFDKAQTRERRARGVGPQSTLHIHITSRSVRNFGFCGSLCRFEAMVSNASSASLGKLPRLIARRRRRGASRRLLSLIFVRGAALAWIYGSISGHTQIC